MTPLNLEDVDKFIGLQLRDFFQQRIQILSELKLDDLLDTNLYLLLPKCLQRVDTLVIGLLENFLTLSEDKLFAEFLENLAIFVVEKMHNGHKSTIPNVSFEFECNGIYYLVAVKHGPDFGDNFQQNELKYDLQQAMMQVEQLRKDIPVQPVIGICYGKSATSHLSSYLKVEGQNFWYLISSDKDLYIKIIEPIGYRAKEHNDEFWAEKARVTNRFTKAFLDDFCDASGSINWERVVAFNSANFDLEEFAGL